MPQSTRRRVKQIELVWGIETRAIRLAYESRR